MDSSIDNAIEQLATLQEMDRQLREKSELAQSLLAEIASLENQLIALRETTQVISAERDAIDARRREVEAQLEDEEGKMKDRRMRLNRVRNEKELGALRREIEVGKEANQQREEEILQLMEQLEVLTARSGDAERAETTLASIATEQCAGWRTRIEQLNLEVEEGRQLRTRISQALDPVILRKYDQIFERRGGTAVVEVRNGICLGCHMNLPPQFFNELQRARDVRLCPNCHRILFWRAERLEPTDPPR